MTSNLIVYSLVDPDSGLIRYVGKSTKGLSRPKSHCQPSRLRADPHTYKSRWIKGLLAQGKTPDIFVLDICENTSELETSEKKWIAHLRKLMVPLTNSTDGGDGMSGHKPSAETRAKISAANKGKPVSPDHRAKIGVANSGRSPSLEARAKMSAVHKGKPKSLWHRARISEANTHYKRFLGKKHGPETIAKMRETHLRRWEKKRLLSESQPGIAYTPTSVITGCGNDD